MQPLLSIYASMPLSISDPEIRVLVVEPGHRHTPIHSSMELFNLDDPKREPYAALSYTWGDQVKTHSIFVQGQEALVTQNLFNALQYLRSLNHPLTIWADALCINQSDNVERSSQVAMMDYIYRDCEIVHMWLGCLERPITSHHSPFALVEHFRDDKHFFELPGYCWDDNGASWKCDTEDPDFRSMMDSFILLYNSTWWVRAWTAQEAILPKVAVFRYGDWTLPLDDFWTCQLNRTRHLGSSCCVDAYRAVGGAPGPRATIDYVLTVVGCVKSMQDKNGPYKTLLDVSRRFANRKCFDPRDNIYCLLGFLSPNMPKILPDYTKPVGEVYHEIFRAMINEREGNLSTLLGEGFNSGKFGLPSWVPDFSGSNGEPGYFLTRALRAYPFFNASGGKSGKLKFGNDKTLLVSGVCIDKVEAKSKLIHAAWASNFGHILNDWRRTCHQQGINISTTSRDEAFSLLLVGEMIEDLLTTNYHPLQTNSPDLPTDAQWERCMRLDSDPSMLPRAYRITVGCMVDRKVLFVTSGGRIGLSWPVVEVGDEVWILDGANTPFILRKNGKDSRDNSRLLVGDAYLYGVMNGESVDEARASEPVILI